MGAALALAALSAVLHATWNLAGKRGGGGQASLAFFIAAESCAALLMLAALPWAVPRVAGWPGWCWGLLAASCALQAGSYICIAAAYRRADLSASYPLIRALPALALTLGGGLLGWRDPGAVAIGGAAVLATGGLLIPLPGWSAWRRLGGGLGDPAVLGAALCICGYGITDAVLVREARQSAGEAAAPALACLMATGNSLLGWLAVATIPVERTRVATLRGSWRRAGLTGLGIWLSYGVMLAALALSTHPGPPTAMRQLAIPLAAILGVLVLKEGATMPRWLGVGLIAVGVALTALG